MRECGFGTRKRHSHSPGEGGALGPEGLPANLPVDCRELNLLPVVLVVLALAAFLWSKRSA